MSLKYPDKQYGTRLIEDGTAYTLKCQTSAQAAMNAVKYP